MSYEQGKIDERERILAILTSYFQPEKEPVSALSFAGKNAFKTLVDTIKNDL